MRPSFAAILVSSLALVACGTSNEPQGAATSAPSGAASAAPSALAAPKDAPAEALVITAKSPSVGAKIEEHQTSDVKMVLSLDLGGQKKDVEVTESESIVKRTEVLAVDGKAVTKARITFVERRKVQVEAGREKKQPKSPVEGKSYVLEAKDGKLAITDDAGKKISKAEDDLIRKTHADFGKPDPVLAALPEQPIKVGERLDAMGKAMGDLLQGRDPGKEAPEVGAIEVKLASIEKQGADSLAVFAVSVTFASPKASRLPFTMSAPLEGQLKVRAKDGAPMSVGLSGRMSMDGTDPKLKVTGRGRMKFGIDFSY